MYRIIEILEQEYSLSVTIDRHENGQFFYFKLNHLNDYGYPDSDLQQELINLGFEFSKKNHQENWHQYKDVLGFIWFVVGLIAIFGAGVITGKLGSSADIATKSNNCQSVKKFVHNVNDQKTSESK